MTSLCQTSIDSPVGVLRLVATQDSLMAVLWPEEREGRVKFASEPQVLERSAAKKHTVLAATSEQLGQYFQGKRRTFELPLVLRGTDFQQQVWRSLADIPFGETSTYGEQAVVIGRPSAVRAVGSANGRNPLSIVLPCHRIVGANGSLAGFAGGLETKRWLLDHEAELAAG